jgi:hypothetical protein
MIKKMLYSAVIFTLVALLAACSSISIPGVTAAANPASQAQNQGGQNNNFSDPSKIPVQSKLGIGILKLEGTPNAITPDQAKVMLPLWQAMKALTPNSNTSQDEITALDQQIQDALTPAQETAIQNLTWTSADLRALEQQYGIQFGGGAGGNFGNLTDSQRATRVAQFQAQGGANRQGGGGGGFAAGGGGGGGGGVPGGGGFGAGGQTTGQRRTPVPGQTANRGNRGGMNFLFADPVIKLLQQKAAS